MFVVSVHDVLDLSKICLQFHSVQSVEFMANVKQFELNNETLIVDDTEHVLTRRPIVLADFDSCQHLQIGITLVKRVISNSFLINCSLISFSM